MAHVVMETDKSQNLQMKIERLISLHVVPA